MFLSYLVGVAGKILHLDLESSFVCFLGSSFGFEETDVAPMSNL